MLRALSALFGTHNLRLLELVLHVDLVAVLPADCLCGDAGRDKEREKDVRVKVISTDCERRAVAGALAALRVTLANQCA